MKVKGEYRDIITENEEIIEDRGWKPNNISKDLGKLIAALMRNNDFTNLGIFYMAVGSSITAGEEGETKFKKRLIENVFFQPNSEQPSPDYDNPQMYYNNKDDWAWVKEIRDIYFLNDQNEKSLTITNKLHIEVTFERKDKSLSGKTFEFKEFALLGRGAYNGKGDIFFINYVPHDPISLKFQDSDNDKTTDFTRTVRLTF